MMKAVLAFSLLLVVGFPAAAQDKARVYYAMDTNAIGPARSVQARVVRRMVDSLVCSVTGTQSVAGAWRSLISPGDKVGIKVSATGRSVSGTNPEVVDAIVDGLTEAGLPAKNIISGIRASRISWSGLKSKEPLRSKASIPRQLRLGIPGQRPLLGRLTGAIPSLEIAAARGLLSSGQQLSSQSYLAKVLTTRVNKVINVPSLADSYLTGINGGIVNMTLPNIDNWRRFAKSAAAGDSYISEIYADPMIRNKVVLTFLDALFLQYAGGPFPDPNFSIENFAIFVSKDPVAIDATAARLIEEARKGNKMPSIKPMIAYLEAASQLGLGVSAEWRIQMIRVGVEGIR
jgi:uncharacterized protein (DUF362 family)